MREPDEYNIHKARLSCLSAFRPFGTHQYNHAVIEVDIGDTRDKDTFCLSIARTGTCEMNRTSQLSQKLRSHPTA